MGGCAKRRSVYERREEGRERRNGGGKRTREKFLWSKDDTACRENVRRGYSEVELHGKKKMDPKMSPGKKGES